MSAKDGTNLNDLMKQIAKKIPAPKKSKEANLQALIIDSWYDNFLGVISLIRIFSGSLKKGEKFIVKSTGQTYTADTIGKFTPKKVPCTELSEGEVGYLVASVKDLKYLALNKIFLMSISRFSKEEENKNKSINSIIKFEFINSSKSKNIDQKDPNLLLKLLTIDIFKKNENFEIIMLFSKNRIITLSAEVIEVTLEDQKIENDKRN